MKKNNKSFEIGIIVFMIVFSLIIFGIYLLVDLYKEKNTYTLFTNPFQILKCVKFKCEDVSEKLEDYNNNKYNIFLDGKSIGENKLYYSKNNNKFYVFNTFNNNIYNNERLLAINGMNIKEYDFNLTAVSNNEVRSIIDDKYNASLVDYSYKIDMDFDGDNESESLYLFSYYDAYEEVNSFALLYYYDSGKLYLLDETLGKDILFYGNAEIINIFDIYEDGKLEFIYSNKYYTGNCNIMFRLKRGKFVKANECNL